MPETIVPPGEVEQYVLPVKESAVGLALTVATTAVLVTLTQPVVVFLASAK